MSRAKSFLLLSSLLVLNGCWESDGTIRPQSEETHAPDVVGPLGQRLPIDETLEISGLSAPVDIVRDDRGVVHIYAQSHDDIFRAQGYAMARDRALQIEMLRRMALGRTAEVLGEVSPETIDRDIAMRSLGISSVVEFEALLVHPTIRYWIDAFANGVDQYFEKIRSGQVPVPAGGSAFRPRHFDLFSAIDVLAIEKLMQFAMSWNVSSEMAASRFIAAVQSTGDSENEALRRRAGMLPDLLRFAPSTAATVSNDILSNKSFPLHPDLEAPLVDWKATGPSLRPALDAWDGIAQSMGMRGTSGSNVWALSPIRSASGGSLLALDAHHRLTSPAALWLVHLQVADENGRHGPFGVGAAFPGIPGLAHGFHEHLAWAASPSGFDVTDVYVETVDESASGVVFAGTPVPFSTQDETIRLPSGEELTIQVRFVPHHGPVIPVIEDHRVSPPAPGDSVLSIRWAGFEPTRDLEASLFFLAAKSLENALTTVTTSPSPFRSYVFTTPKDIAYLAPTRILQRDERSFAWDASTYRGRLPCMALPGDGSSEWLVPRAVTTTPYLRNPETGFVITTHVDPVGGTLDNDPSNDVISDGSRSFLGCLFDDGFRQSRIHDRLMESFEPLGLMQASSIQADVRSELASRLLPALFDAFNRVKKERSAPGTYPLLTDVASSGGLSDQDLASWSTLLQTWEKQGGLEALTGVVFADMSLTEDSRERNASRASLLFHAWIVRLVESVFADEMSALGLNLHDLTAISPTLPIRSLLYLLERQPSALGTFDGDLGDSLLWDDLTTKRLECRDDRLVNAWLDAVDWLESHLGSDPNWWRWGLVHTARFTPLDASMDALTFPALSDVNFRHGFPRQGGLFTVDGGGFDLLQPMNEAPRFPEISGASLRMTMRYGAKGPEAVVALAGGQQADPSAPHFRDSAESWRHNTTHALVHRLDDVLSRARSREVACSP